MIMKRRIIALLCAGCLFSLTACQEDIEITDEQWEECMERIPDMSDVAHYPYKVTKEMLTEAMDRLRERVRKDNEEE